MRVRHALSPATLLFIGCLTPAWAQEEPTIRLSAAYARQTDSNLYRLSATSLTNAQTLIGRADASEQIGITTLGVNFNKAYSLQRLELGLNLVDYSYQNFSNLSFTAQNYTAAWRWALTPRLTGNLTRERSETLNSFADTPGTTARNQRTNSNTRFDAIYEINGPWRALAGVSTNSQTNQQVIPGERDYSSHSADVGTRYVFTSGSNLGYTLRKTNGNYTNTGNTQDNSFEQTDHELKLTWMLSGKSQANLRAAHINRNHPSFAQRDYSGLNAGVNINWGISAKTSLAASWTRELASYQTTYSNNTQTDRRSIGPAWQVTPKAAVRLRYEVATIDYLNPPTGGVSSPRSDTTTDTVLSVNWQPSQRFTLSTSLQNAKRTSNVPNRDYASNQVTLSAQYSY